MQDHWPSLGPSPGKLGAIVNVRSSSLPHPIASAGSLQLAPCSSPAGFIAQTKKHSDSASQCRHKFCCPWWSGVFYEMFIYSVRLGGEPLPPCWTVWYCGVQCVQRSVVQPRARPPSPWPLHRPLVTSNKAFLQRGISYVDLASLLPWGPRAACSNLHVCGLTHA